MVWKNSALPSCSWDADTAFCLAFKGETVIQTQLVPQFDHFLLDGGTPYALNTSIMKAFMVSQET